MRQLRCIWMGILAGDWITWTVDRDCTLVRAQNSGSTVIISLDPTLNAGTIKTPTVKAVTEIPLIAFLTADGGSGQTPLAEVNYPLRKGMQVTMMGLANCSALLWIADDLPSL